MQTLETLYHMIQEISKKQYELMAHLREIRDACEKLAEVVKEGKTWK